MWHPLDIFFSLRKIRKRKEKLYIADLSTLLFTCLYYFLILSNTNYTCVQQYPPVTVGLQYCCNLPQSSLLRKLLVSSSTNPFI